jgi:hypothetical protein
MKLLRSVVHATVLVLPSMLHSQSVTLDLVPSSANLSACPGESFEVTAHLSNPGRLEVGGYQIFLRFPAEYFEAVRYEPLEIEALVETGGREPFGDGYEPCTTGVTDGWGDLAGEDVVSVIASAYGTGSPDAFQGESADLGRFIFKLRGKLTEGDGVAFHSNTEACYAPLDQSTEVFGTQGQGLLAADPTSFTVSIRDSGPFVTNFVCQDNGDSVTLTWTEPKQAGVGGYRIYRNGDPIATYPIPAVSSHVDHAPPAGNVRYEIAVLRQGGGEGCRDECRVEREVRFIRGDANRNNAINITDAVTVLAYLFQGSSISCEDAADADDDGRVLLTDAVRILGRLFQGDPPLPPPTTSPGADPTPDSLTCAS